MYRPCTFSVCRQFAACLTVGFSCWLGLVDTGLTSEPDATWSRFRGPNGSGVIGECHVPLPWQPNDVAWEVELPGIGNSSPIVWGQQVYLMSADPDSAERYVLCYDLGNGQELWRRTYASTPYHLHARSSFASGTPAVSEEAVYFSWATPNNVVLKAFSHAGEELWSKDLGPFVSQHGFGASPALFGDKLILFNSQQAEELAADQAPGQAKVLAFQADSGELLWEQSCASTRVCYGVPSLFKDESGADALLFADTGEGLFALRLEDGQPLWSKKVFTKRSVSCPQVIGDLAIGTEGSGGGGNKLFAVSLHGDHEVRFTIDRSAPYVPTPVAKGELLFLWDDKGIVSCVRLTSGEVAWTKRVGGNVSSSPIIAGEKLVGIAEDGTVTVLSASETYHEYGATKLNDTTRATPYAAADFLLFRSNGKLIKVGQ